MGYITDCSTGKGIVGAVLSLEKGWLTVATSTGGFYSFHLVETGTYTLDISADGYESKTVTVTHVDESYKNFCLTPKAAPPPPAPPPAPTIEGHVKDLKTGEAISGATVTWQTQIVSSDMSGYYKIESAITASGTITCEAPGYELEKDYIEVPETGTLTHDFYLTPTAPAPAPTEKYVIEGHVTDASTHAPIADALVRFGTDETRTDSAGYYRLELTEGFKYTLSVSKTGYNNYYVEVDMTSPGTKTVDVELGKPSGIDILAPLKSFGDWFLTQFANVVKVGTSALVKPEKEEERKSTADLFKAIYELMQTEAKTKLEEFKASHSPMTPEESEKWALAFAGAGATGFGLGLGASFLAEALGLGQIETVGRWLQEGWVRTGLAAMFGVPLALNYEIAIRRPYTSLLLSRYQPTIPGVTDLVTFTTREAFPDVLEEWIETLPPEEREEMKKEFATLDSPFFKAMIKWAKYQGLSEYWSKAYWHSHWRLPSVDQFFEMRWRDLITDETLRRMLLVSDIHPAWAERLFKIAYRVPRIYDARAAWEFGDIDDETFLRKIKDSGFAPEDVKWILASQKRFVFRDELSRVRSELVRHFITGLLTKDKLASELKKLGYREEVVELQVKEAELRKTREKIEDLISTYSSQLTHELITDDEFIKKLMDLGISEVDARAYADLAIAKRKPAKVKAVVKTGVKIYSKPSYAEIWVDEVDTGKLTPETLELTPGKHAILLKAPGYYDTCEVVDVVEGKIKEVRLELVKIVGE